MGAGFTSGASADRTTTADPTDPPTDPPTPHGFGDQQVWRPDRFSPRLVGQAIQVRPETLNSDELQPSLCSLHLGRELPVSHQGNGNNCRAYLSGWLCRLNEILRSHEPGWSPCSR